MLPFAANLSTLFTERPLLERFEASASCGFQYVEIQFPYEASLEELRYALKHTGQSLILINAPAGNWSDGDRGIACQPERQTEFQDGVPLALEYAKALNVKKVNCLSGIENPNVDKILAENTFIENLRYAVNTLKQSGIRLLIEPINTIDIPGFWLNSTAQAVKIIEQSKLTSDLFVQFDAYHMQMMGENLTESFLKHQAMIHHVQVADAPGRHEPGTGEIDFDAFFHLLKRANYQGFVSFEYFPATTTAQGLPHLAPWHDDKRRWVTAT
jgi:hydroxypyruvate isomerase